MEKEKLKKLYEDLDEFLGNNIETLEDFYESEFHPYSNDVKLLDFITLGGLYEKLGEVLDD